MFHCVSHEATVKVKIVKLIVSVAVVVCKGAWQLRRR